MEADKHSDIDALRRELVTVRRYLMAVCISFFVIIGINVIDAIIYIVRPT